MEGKITVFEFLKKSLSGFLINSFVVAITGLGFIPYFIFYLILSVFGIEENIKICISISISLFLILIYSAYDIVKDLVLSSNEVIKYNKLKKEEADNYLKIKCDEFKNIVGNQNLTMPYLSEIFADYLYLCDMQISRALLNKKNPAIKSAEQVRILAKEKKEIQKAYKMLQYQLSIYEKVFPMLEEFKEVQVEDLKEILNTAEEDEEYDVVKKWISPDEYNKLSLIDKYQLALDRYKNSRSKSLWQIGIEFERYIGFLYEKDNYKVKYQGALDGMEDMGIDLIVEKENVITVVQCKYWSQKKVIHEKHIFQLYGTMVLKQIEFPNKIVKGEFITTTNVSDVAKKVAKKINIEIKENIPFEKDYACIKCNVSKKDGSKIYHLPFDQQYDNITIEYDRGECYVSTIKEAEKLGFKRAMRWSGN